MNTAINDLQLMISELTTHVYIVNQRGEKRDITKDLEKLGYARSETPAEILVIADEAESLRDRVMEHTAKLLAVLRDIDAFIEKLRQENSKDER